MSFLLEAKLPFERSTPDRDLKSLMLYDNPARKVKNGANLPPLVKEELIKCLRANSNLFACSPEDVPGMYPIISFRKLNVNPNAGATYQKNSLKEDCLKEVFPCQF